MMMHPFATVLVALIFSRGVHAFVPERKTNVDVPVACRWHANQHHKLSTSPPHVLRMSRNTGATLERDALLELSSKRKHQPFPLVLLSVAFLLGICGSTPQLASAAEDVADAASSPTTSIESEGAKTSGTDTSTTARPSGISNYFSQVFSSPDYGANPRLTDSRFDDKDSRNRAYDDAFQQDARDRDAYYGKMAMLKRERALQEVSQNRKALGLDGDGDVRPRVGDEKVAGMASLRQYLLQQDPSTLTPEELKVYNRMKEREQIDEDI